MTQAEIVPPPLAVDRPAAPPVQPDGGDRQSLLGGLLLTIGAIWITVPLLGLMTGAPPPIPDLGAVGTGLVLAVGAGQALWGLHLLLRGTTLTIDQNRVQVSVRGLLGVRRWSEPLANYRGLRHRRERIRHRYGWRIVHRLQLAHPDASKEIELIRTLGEHRIAAAGRQWSAWLGLPIWAGNDTVPRRPADEPDRREVETNGVASF